MPIAWTEMIESGFDPKLYREDAPFGTWNAKLDLAVYAKTRKVGIHVYLSNDKGEKFWFFSRWLGGAPVHRFLKDSAQVGDTLQLEILPSKKAAKPFINSVSKVVYAPRQHQASPGR